MKDYVSGDLHNPAHERKARDAVSVAAYKAATDAALADVKAAPALMDEMRTLRGQVAALERALDRDVNVTARVTMPAEPRAAARVPSKADAVFGGATAELLRRAKHADVDKVLDQLFPGEMGRLQRKAAKAATRPGSTTDVSFGQSLVDSQLRGWIDELLPVSVLAGIMAAGGIDIPMGRQQSIKFPNRAGTGHLAGAFVGENNSIPVKQTQFGSVNIARYKAAVISTFSRELAETSAPDIERTLRDMVRSDTAQMLDAKLLDVNADIVAGIAPASPWYGATNAPSSGSDLQSILTDVAFLVNAVAHGGSLRNPVLIMDNQRALRLTMTRDTEGWVFRDDLRDGHLMGTPVIVSSSVPVDAVYCIEASDFGAWLPAPELDTSEQAAVVMLDDDGTDPTMAATNAIDAGGSVHVSDAASVTGGPAQVVSTFQSALIALRLVQPVAWSMLRQGSTSYVTSVAW